MLLTERAYREHQEITAKPFSTGDVTILRPQSFLRHILKKIEFGLGAESTEHN